MYSWSQPYGSPLSVDRMRDSNLLVWRFRYGSVPRRVPPLRVLDDLPLMSLGKPCLDGDLPQPHTPSVLVNAGGLAQADVHVHPSQRPLERVVVGPAHTLESRRSAVEEKRAGLRECSPVAAKLAKPVVELLGKPLDEGPPRHRCELFARWRRHVSRGYAPSILLVGVVETQV